MSRTSSPEPLRPTQLEVRLPPLHEAQQAVALDESQFKVVVCGRQWGKTVLGAVMCVGEAAQGGDVWWVAPSFPVGELGWKIIDELCRQIPGTRFEGRPIFRITLPSGGSIQLRSADNPDSLRGATLNGVVFDEAAQAKPEAWPTLEPTLAIRHGWAMFISTPKGTNWFRELYDDAQRLDGWKTWQFPSASSPYMTTVALEAARKRHVGLWFSQEYLAEFVADDLAAFHAEWIQHYRTRLEDEDRFFILGNEVVALSECQKFHTVDLAWSQAETADYTVIASWAVTQKRHLILLDVIRGHFEGPDIVPKMQLTYDKWGGPLVVERATRQMSIIQEAVRSGLPVREVKPDKDKDARAWPAQARMEQRAVWFPDRQTPWWPAIEEEILSFPAGKHDDFVDCLSYACLQIATRSRYEDGGLVTV
jgi:predicted phage terminase large subunit-like protein